MENTKYLFGSSSLSELLSSAGSDGTADGTFRFFTIGVTSGGNWAEIERSTGPSSSVPPLILDTVELGTH